MIRIILAEYPIDPIIPTVRDPNFSLYLPQKGDAKNHANAEIPKIRETSTSFNPLSRAKIGIEVKTKDCPRPMLSIVKKIQR